MMWVKIRLCLGNVCKHPYVLPISSESKTKRARSRVDNSVAIILSLQFKPMSTVSGHRCLEEQRLYVDRGWDRFKSP